ncbi:hypothetical protein V5799_014750, partial [Amblyomma americanum]
CTLSVLRPLAIRYFSVEDLSAPESATRNSRRSSLSFCVPLSSKCTPRSSARLIFPDLYRLTDQQTQQS